MKENTVIIIDGDYYKVRHLDPGFLHKEDKGLWRCSKVRWNSNNHWSAVDDDDYMLTDDGTVVAREIGWGLRRVEI